MKEDNNVQDLEKIVQFITSGLKQYESISIRSDDSLLCVSKSTEKEYPLFSIFNSYKIVNTYIPREIFVPKSVIKEFRTFLNTTRHYIMDNKEIQGIMGEWEDIYFFEYNNEIYSLNYGLFGAGAEMKKTEKTEIMSFYRTGYTDHIIKFANLNKYYIDRINSNQDENNKVKIIESPKYKK